MDILIPTCKIIEWQRSLPKPPEPITANMLSWMRYFKTPCPLLCCYSGHCASINCNSCKAKLSTRPPKTRYICMQCAPKEELYQIPCAEYCEDCFKNPKICHDHDSFCKIDHEGIHSAVQRYTISERK